MTEAAIFKALEVSLRDQAPNFATAWENANFAPVSGTPFQSAFVKLAKPENPTMGDGHYRQRGYLQISLSYPSNEGAGPARARAGDLRAHYRRGLSLTADGVTTVIDRTPEIGSGSNEGDRYNINVFVSFYADIFGA